MSCTRLFIKGKITPRLFCIFERDKPYELVLKYKRLLPKESGGSGFGAGTHFHWTDVQKIEFTKTRTIRVSSEKAGQEILSKLQDQTMCFKCGNDPSKCSKNLRLLDLNLAK